MDSIHDSADSARDDSPWPPRPELEPEFREPGRSNRLPLQGLGIALSLLVVLAAVGIRLVVPLLIPVEVTEADDRIPAMLMRVQGAYLVAASEALPQDPSFSLADQAAESMDLGSLALRCRFVVLVADLDGAAEGRRRLDALEDLLDDARAQGYEPTEDDLRVMELLRTILPESPDLDADAVSDAERLERIAALSPADRDLLIAELDWFGELALAPADGDPVARAAVMATPRRVFVILIAMVVIGGAAFCAGFIGLIVMTVLALTRRMRSRVRQGEVPAAALLETFSIWLVFFFGLQITAGGIAMAVGRGELLLSFVAFLASLCALAWIPLRTGCSFDVVRRDIGLVGGDGAVEPVFGVMCYVCGLPIVLIGLILTYVLLVLQGAMSGATTPGSAFDSAGGPAHPIVGELANGNVAVLLQVLLIGSVAAPIVEETMFRGVLYQALRDFGRPLGIGLSVLAATVANTAVFALIHPQGLVAVPALMGLAVAFTLAREWRGSLVAPMTMHAMSNAIVLLTIFNLFGS